MIAPVFARFMLSSFLNADVQQKSGCNCLIFLVLGLVLKSKPAQQQGILVHRLFALLPLLVQ